MKRRSLLQGIATAIVGATVAPLLPKPERLLVSHVATDKPLLLERSGQLFQGPYLPRFNVGDVVRFSGFTGREPSGLYVITGESSLHPFGARQ